MIDTIGEAKKLAIYALVGAAAFWSVPSVVAQEVDEQFSRYAFVAADSDGNGCVSEAEFVMDVATAFSDLDETRDGVLVVAELAEPDKEKMVVVDQNSDGRITFIEVMTRKHMAFQAADKDGDGCLAMEEVLQHDAAQTGGAQ